MKKIYFLILFLNLAISLSAQKAVYIPSFITNENMDLNDPNSQWCYCRSMETENFVVFWEPGFGTNPSTAAGDYQVNMDVLLEAAEKSFTVYVDSLEFATRGSSVIDDYKIMIFMLYSTEWAAYGSGQDNLVGTLHVNPAAARSNIVLAHEIGHTFQYITGCDTDGGYRYGFGPNGQGGNGFWEQCANWMAFKVYPQSQFTSHDFSNYIRNNHLHILHETPRYANYFIQDYWTFKRGKDFTGRLWRESRYPEDPVETYKRLSSMSQEQFNDEIYEHAARLTTWDIPEIRPYGEAYINSRAQVTMNLTDDNFWKIDPSVCIENYGYNSIKLNAPSQATQVTVHFKGLAGETGFRALNTDKGGWRYGFVALLENGARVYSEMATATVENGINPVQYLSFTCPDNCTNLWLVVSGAPQQHWRHAWDDDNTNDEQWPYMVQFENTNLLGVYTNPIHDVTLTYNITMDPLSDYTATTVSLNSSRICEAFAMSPEAIANALGSTITYYAINPDGSLDANSTAIAPGHWYAKTGATAAWGANAYVYSELNINSLVANIGQYPGRCQPGEQYTVKQALVYNKSQTESAQVTLIFNININAVTGGKAPVSESMSFYPNPTNGLVHFSEILTWELTNSTGNEIVKGKSASIDLSPYSAGVYFIKIISGQETVIERIIKK